MGVIRTILAVDGETKFRNSMKEVNSALKAMQSNVKALSTEYVTNGTRIDHLVKQSQQLKEMAHQLEEKQKLLQGAVNRSTESYDKAKQNYLDMVWLHGRESQEAEKASKALTAATVTMNNYASQLAQTEAQLNETTNAYRELDQEIESGTKGNKLGDAILNISKGFKNLGSGIGTLAKVEFAALKVSTKAVTAEFDVALNGLTAYTAAIATATTAVGKFAVDSGAKFEQSISKLGAISGASAADMKKLEAAAEETGISTSKSAAESADALTYMALAGWKTEDMLKGLNPIVRASEAGAMDLATASDLITDSLAAYGKNADDLSKYLDIVTKAQSSSNTSMQQMLEAYVEVGGTFKNLNVPMEESAAILGVLANRGIKGSEAGNKLSSTLVNLVGANKNAASAMDELGVSAWDDNGEFIGLSETIKRLGSALENVTDEELVKFEAKIGGKMQIDTLQALIAGTSDEFDGLVETLENSKGALEETAEEMLNNFNGAVTLAKSAIEGLGLSLFKVFGDDLKENVQNVASFASAISKTIKNGGSVVGVINKLAADARKTLKSNILNFSKILPEITGVFNAVFLQVIDSILKTSTMAVSNFVPKLVDGFFELVNGITDRLPEIGEELGFGLKRLFDTLIPNMQEFAENLSSELPAMLDNFLSYFDGEGAGQIFNAGLNILMTLIQGIVSNLPLLLKEGADMLVTMLNGILEQLPQLIDTAVEILVNLVDAIVDNIDMIIEVSLKIIIALIEGLIKNLDKIIDQVPKLINAIVDGIIDNLDLLIKAAIEIVLALGSALVGSIDLIYGSLEEVINHIVEKFADTDWSEVGKNILKGIADGFLKVGSYITEKVSQAGEFIKGKFESFWDINSPSKKARDDIGKFIGLGIAEGTADGLEDSGTTLNRAAENYSQDLADATKKAFINTNINYVPAATSGANVSVVNRFENVVINRDIDIENLSYRIAETTKSYLVGGGE